MEELAEQGRIHFTRVHSLPELNNALANGSYDVLTISLHGTADDGVEYRMLLPDKPSSPRPCSTSLCPDRRSRLLLVGQVSGHTRHHRRGTVLSDRGRVTGHRRTVGHRMAGELLTRTYDGHLRHGLPLAQAFRAAHLALPRNDHPAAAGLAFMGHP
ncbi:hypothetical protein ACFCX6_32230 [Streptomyces sp. NPDC056353]|uniref:hypothetical protein n=1 Tax=Streptomyces sp. NPDC056353 TaxID=3345792 RepID=UPI0035DB0CBF